MRTISDKFRKAMSFVCNTAWMLVKKYGFTLGEGMRQAWRVLKLKRQMKQGIVKFMFKKLDGTLRTAWGTLKEDLIAPILGTGQKPNKTLCVYYDTEKDSYRSFKIANLIEVCQ